MKTFKPGELIWCAEGGAVKQVEVVEQLYRCSNETGIKYPNDDVMQPWYCWNGYLFKTRKAAVRLACKQLQDQIDLNRAQIKELQKDVEKLESDLEQLQDSLEPKGRSRGSGFCYTSDPNSPRFWKSLNTFVNSFPH